MFFAIFEFFHENLSNMGQKLGSNRCPLFTMLTKQNSSMFCIVSFVKKNSKCFFFFLFYFPSFSLLLSFSLFYFSFLFFSVRSHRAISLNENQNLRGWANLRSRPTIPFNQNQYPVWLGKPEIPSGDPL